MKALHVALCQYCSTNRSLVFVFLSVIIIFSCLFQLMLDPPVYRILPLVSPSPQLSHLPVRLLLPLSAPSLNLPLQSPLFFLVLFLLRALLPHLRALSHLPQLSKALLCLQALLRLHQTPVVIAPLLPLAGTLPQLLELTPLQAHLAYLLHLMGHPAREHRQEFPGGQQILLRV